VTVTFRRDVRGAAFLELLEVMAGRATTAGLVASPFELTDGLSEATRSLLSTLDGALLSRDEVRAWPGVEVPDWAAASVLLTFRYDTEVARALYDHCPKLLGWQEYGLPHDLHFTDADGRTILGSISSEDDAWVTVSKEEWRELVKGTRHLRWVGVRVDRS
jgi:hypothetical protein